MEYELDTEEWRNFSGSVLEQRIRLYQICKNPASHIFQTEFFANGLVISFSIRFYFFLFKFYNVISHRRKPIYWFTENPSEVCLINDFLQASIKQTTLGRYKENLKKKQTSEACRVAFDSGWLSFLFCYKTILILLSVITLFYFCYFFT